jgi:hypothetical protein
MDGDDVDDKGDEVVVPLVLGGEDGDLLLANSPSGSL